MINFIDSTDPVREHSCRVWVIVSLILVVTVICIILYIQIPCCMECLSLRKEYRNIKSMLSYGSAPESRELDVKHEHDILNRNLTAINTMRENFNNRVKQLEVMRKTCVNGVELSSCTLSDKQVSIALVAPSIDIIHKAVSTLVHSEKFDTLLLTSVTQRNDGLHVLLKSLLKY